MFLLWRKRFLTTRKSTSMELPSVTLALTRFSKKSLWICYGTPISTDSWRHQTTSSLQETAHSRRHTPLARGAGSQERPGLGHSSVRSPRHLLHVWQRTVASWRHLRWGSLRFGDVPG